MHAQFGHSFSHADIKYSGHFSGAKQIKFMHIYMHKAVKGLVEHYSDDGLKPHWAFLMKFILFCVTLDLSDNLTEMPIMKN